MSEITKIDEEDIKTMERKYIPSMYWLNDVAQERKIDMNLDELKCIAKKLDREDVKLDIEELLTRYKTVPKLNQVRSRHMLSIAEKIKIEPSCWNDWRDFADELRYSCDEIDRISDLAIPSIAALYFLKEQFPDECVSKIQYICSSYGVKDVIGKREK